MFLGCTFRTSFAIFLQIKFGFFKVIDVLISFFMHFERQLECLLWVSLLLLSDYIIMFLFLRFFSKMSSKEGHGSPDNVPQTLLQRLASTSTWTISLICKSKYCMVWSHISVIIISVERGSEQITRKCLVWIRCRKWHQAALFKRV